MPLFSQLRRAAYRYRVDMGPPQCRIVVHKGAGCQAHAFEYGLHRASEMTGAKQCKGPLKTANQARQGIRLAFADDREGFIEQALEPALKGFSAHDWVPLGRRLSGMAYSTMSQAFS